MFPDTWIIKRQIAMPVTESTWGLKKYPTVTIYPIGDLHLGAIGCNERAWADFVDFLKNEDDAYIVVVGDMLDNATKNSIASTYEQIYKPMEAKNILADYLKPIADKILCGVRGNHELRSVRDVDQDPLYDVFCRLNIEDCYRAGTAFLYLQIGERAAKNNNKREKRAYQSYNIVVTHGVGGSSKLIGTGLNNNVRFGQSIDGADCIVSGHTHSPTICKPSKTIFDPQQNEVRTSPFASVQCASWLSYCGYPLQKMMPPQSTWSNDVPQRIELCAKRDKKMIKVTM